MTKEQLEAMARVLLFGTEHAKVVITGVSIDFIYLRYLLGMALQAAADATPPTDSRK